MTKFKNGVFSFFSISAYFVQLNIEWLLFTLLGGVLFGLGPSTATLIKYSNEYREERIEHSSKDYWNSYKDFFKSTSLMGFIFILISIALLLGIRITAVFFKKIEWISPLYTLISLLIIYILIISFFTYVKSTDLTYKNSLRISIFISFRFPLKGLCIILTSYTFLLLFQRKTSLLILFGCVVLIFSIEFFHNQMIEKQKIASNKQ